MVHRCRLDCQNGQICALEETADGVAGTDVRRHVVMGNHVPFVTHVMCFVGASEGQICQASFSDAA